VSLPAFALFAVQRASNHATVVEAFGPSACRASTQRGQRQLWVVCRHSGPQKTLNPAPIFADSRNRPAFKRQRIVKTSRECPSSSCRAPQSDSEHFRFVPRTCPAIRWHADRRSSVCLRSKEIDHERASCTGAAGSGSQHCGSRVLFGPGPPNHASVGLRSSLKASA
jgi:hypothetical protein